MHSFVTGIQKVSSHKTKNLEERVGAVKEGSATHLNPYAADGAVNVGARRSEHDWCDGTDSTSIIAIDTTAVAEAVTARIAMGEEWEGKSEETLFTVLSETGE